MVSAKIKEIWFIVECPHCHRPQTKNRFIHDNIIKIKPINIECEMCLQTFTIDLKVSDDKSMDNR